MRKLTTYASLLMLLSANACGPSGGDDIPGDSAVGVDAGGSELNDTAVSDTSLSDDASAKEDVTVLDTPQPPPADVPQDHVAEDAVSVAPDTSKPSGLIPLSEGLTLADLDSEFIEKAGADAHFSDFVPLPEIPAEFFPCVATATDPDDSKESTFGYDAGEITVSGTLQAVVLSPVDDGDLGTDYASNLSDDLEDLLPQGGAILMVKAAGGPDIGPWTGVLQTPEAVVISGPEMGFGASHSASSPLTITWNAGSGDTVMISLSPLSSGFKIEAGVSVTCWFTGDTGSGVVPAGVLSQVLKGGDGQNLAVGVTRIRNGTAKSATHSVPLTAARASANLLNLTP